MRLQRGGGSLVGILASLVIVMLLVVAMMYGSGAFSRGEKKSPRADGRGTTVPGLVKAKAEDEVCRSNLGQVRMAIQMARTSSPDDLPPATLEETRIGSQFYRCPMGKEPYQYDPATGNVRCVHPGHEGF